MIFARIKANFCISSVVGGKRERVSRSSSIVGDMNSLAEVVVIPIGRLDADIRF